jgi:gamma-glutamylcyclotransferase (GGCT)/AIG2-like uncharacterized protein YtfP
MAPARLYFGYGSNLCGADLAAWCRARNLDPVELIPSGRGFLPDRRLAFTQSSAARGGGVLDVPAALGCAVSGILFRVPGDEAIATLDRKEGEGHSYTRVPAMALTDDGHETPVFAYEVIPERREPFVPPATAYLALVRRAYQSHGLATEPLDAAARDEPYRSPVAGLFVYGTLLRGEERHPVLTRHHAAGAGAAKTAGALIDLGAFPGLVLDGRGGSVAGELYELSDPAALFAELDEIESFRGFGAAGSVYRRAIVRVTRGGGATVPAWTYLYAGDTTGSYEIASGDWRLRLRP